jgi:hypothetical protein
MKKQKQHVGPDGKPRVREFGNVKPSRFGATFRPEITGQIEPVVDVVTTDSQSHCRNA